MLEVGLTNTVLAPLQQGFPVVTGYLLGQICLGSSYFRAFRGISAIFVGIYDANIRNSKLLIGEYAGDAGDFQGERHLALYRLIGDLLKVAKAMVTMPLQIRLVAVG